MTCDANIDVSGYRNLSGSGTLQTVGNATFGANVNISGNIAIAGGFAMGSDAEGDMYYRSGAGVLTRLARGANDQILKMNGNVPNWEAESGGGGGISWDGSTANGIATYKDADEATVESNLTFDGSTLKVAGAVSGSTTLETVGNAYVGGNMAVSGTIEFAGTTKLVNDAGSGEVAKFGTGTLTTGKLYFLHTGSVWLACDAGVVESGSNSLLGIALGSNPLVHGLLTRGYFDVHTYLSGAYAAGRAIYMGSDGAAGYISTYQPSGSGDVVRIVGHAATGTNVIYFNPSPDWIEV